MIKEPQEGILFFNLVHRPNLWTSKDEKGIIMGEFGFITADGYYHITVYATDENGNFKIIKMQNIYIGLPMEKMATPIPGVAGERKEPVREVVKESPKEEVKVNGLAACGGCIVPTKPPVKEESARPSPIARPAAVGGYPKVDQGGVSPGIPGGVKVGVNNPYGPAVGVGGAPDLGGGRAPDLGGDRTPDLGGGRAPDLEGGRPPNLGGSGIKGTAPPVTNNPFSPNIVTGKEETGGGFSPGREQELGSFGKNPQEGLDIRLGGGGLEKPVQTTMYPPQSMMKQLEDALRGSDVDLSGLLYKFNYTFTFHGHDEVGNRAGDKEGGYFVNHRDGVGVNVKYIANEFGYQPNITFRELTEQETPKEDTEKEVNKLHGYEFKWFYRK